ncbi:MAG: hypothetical protein ACSHWZ_14890 [Sulfitobacter sp.]
MANSDGAREPRILIVGACQEPGRELALALAKRGARVVAFGANGPALQALAQPCAGRIEPLAMAALDGAAFERLGAAWGAAPLDVAINLTPLSAPRDVNGALKKLGHILRATARGLIAGQGALITLTSSPKDPLDLQAAAMSGALHAAQTRAGQVLLARGLRLHLVSAPDDALHSAIPALRFLASPAAQGMAPQRIALDHAAF